MAVLRGNACAYAWIDCACCACAGSKLVVELKHYKEKERKMSVLAWSFIPTSSFIQRYGARLTTRRVRVLKCASNASLLACDSPESLRIGSAACTQAHYCWREGFCASPHQVYNRYNHLNVAA